MAADDQRAGHLPRASHVACAWLNSERSKLYHSNRAAGRAGRWVPWETQPLHPSNPYSVKIQHAGAHFQLPCETWQLVSRGGAPGRTPGGFCEGLGRALLGWLAAKSIEVELFKLLLNNRSSFFVAPRAQGLRLVLCKSSTAYHRPGAR